MSEKIVYQCDAQSWFLHETVADESPLEPGVFHIPRGCVETPPPTDYGPDYRPRWDGKRWSIQAIPKPPVEDPVAKLAAFLADHPDVAALLNNQGGV